MTENYGPIDFDTETTDVDTSVPILEGGLYDLVVNVLGTERNKRDDGNNLVVAFKTLDDAQSTRGRTIKPGYTLKSWYALQSKDRDSGEPTNRWLENICQLIDAALDTAQSNRPSLKLGLEQANGRTVRARIVVETDDNGMPRNKIKSFIQRD
jgi:hypothetical protein